ncbi:hypothetical protein F442_12519, partial [Phytophthora nicotianae P10297]
MKKRIPIRGQDRVPLSFSASPGKSSASSFSQLATWMEDIAADIFAGPLLSSLFRLSMNSTGETAEPMAAFVPRNWTHELTVAEGITLVALPLVALVLIYVLLRIVWKVPDSPELPQHTLPSYGSVTSQEESLRPVRRPKTSLVEEGEVAGDYRKHWYNTFDFAFMLGMIVYAAAMLVLTYSYEPQWLHGTHFWLMQLPKLAVMMLVSLIGGVICRVFCDVDEKGYIMTNKSSKFKVNYT